MHIPLIDSLEKYRRRNPVRLHVPGHKGGQALSPVMRQGDLPGWDVTELEGLDDLHNPDGAIAAAQQLAANLYGARHTFFLVNGTTVGIHALISATCAEGDMLVLPRNAHRSVLGGLVLSGARPVFLEPEIVPEFGFAAGFGKDRLKQLLPRRGVAAVLAVHPCYYGVVGDLAGVSELCRRYSVPLIVDEAHGTHLRFHPALPADALSLGADAVVQSVHKTGGAFTQASWLHLGTGRVQREQVARTLRLLQTSSPSYLLLASLDAARQQLARHGGDMLDELLEITQETLRELTRIPGLVVLGKEHLGTCGALDHDPTRLVVSVKGLGLSGYEVGRRLAAGYGVYVEMADAFNVVAVLAPGTGREDARALVRALADISLEARRDARLPRVVIPPPAGPPVPPQVTTPRRAWLSPQRSVPLEESRGRVCGEIIAVYPPGTAIIYPGEEITPEVIEYLLQVRASGLHCQGAADPALRTVRVAD
jgi:arginine/lysine/ornithine decarboxylase